MTVIEVQEHFRQLWEHEQTTLNLLFGTLRRGPLGEAPPRFIQDDDDDVPWPPR